jgi:hypothetical protein
MTAIKATKSTAADLMNSIKRDNSHHRKLNNEANWDDWKCSTLATVASNVFEAIKDPTYVHKDQDELEFFKEMHKFMYNVIIATL